MPCFVGTMVKGFFLGAAPIWSCAQFSRLLGGGVTSPTLNKLVLCRKFSCHHRLAEVGVLQSISMGAGSATLRQRRPRWAFALPSMNCHRGSKGAFIRLFYSQKVEGSMPPEFHLWNPFEPLHEG